MAIFYLKADANGKLGIVPAPDSPVYIVQSNTLIDAELLSPFTSCCIACLLSLGDITTLKSAEPVMCLWSIMASRHHCGDLPQTVALRWDSYTGAVCATLYY